MTQQSLDASGGKASAWSSWVALFASSGTLVCCALPALLVALGAGAALSTLVSVVPGLVWLSEYKGLVFGAAGVMLALSGVLQWQNRFAPCPVDPALRQACLRTRKTSARVYSASLLLYVVGGWFAFVQPWLQDL
ncbi:hypothetical protein [Polaromonas sp. SM01]|uniref:hypothetical protein n=1 Tax=Polaromonas sp. SM01 TaxID=3085630 RepID=UPI002981F9A5|nr:hypothetical protein [Polaromonas sp. SM01]MDW5443514.1 hypothetical protein [Polaromonas sp. SM01]